MMMELDKVMSLFENAEQERVDMIRKIQILKGLDDQESESSGEEGKNSD